MNERMSVMKMVEKENEKDKKKQQQQQNARSPVLRFVQEKTWGKRKTLQITALLLIFAVGCSCSVVLI